MTKLIEPTSVIPQSLSKCHRNKKLKTGSKLDKIGTSKSKKGT